VVDQDDGATAESRPPTLNDLLMLCCELNERKAKYIAFYSSQRPHQGIQQQIPRPSEPRIMSGAIRKSAVLGGLHHHYFRQAA